MESHFKSKWIFGKRRKKREKEGNGLEEGGKEEGFRLLRINNFSREYQEEAIQQLAD